MTRSHHCFLSFFLSFLQGSCNHQIVYVLLDDLCTAWWFMYCLMIYVLITDFMHCLMIYVYCLMIYVLLDDLCTAWWFTYCLMIYGLFDDLWTAWWFMYCLMIYVLFDDLCTAWWFMVSTILIVHEQFCSFFYWTNNFQRNFEKIIVLLNERFVSNKLIFIKMNDFTELINDHSVRKQMKKVENEW